MKLLHKLLITSCIIASHIHPMDHSAVTSTDVSPYQFLNSPSELILKIIAASPKNVLCHVCKYLQKTSAWQNREAILATELPSADGDHLSHIAEKKDWVLDLSYRDAKTILHEQLSQQKLSPLVLLIARYIKHRFKENPMKIGLPDSSPWKFIGVKNRNPADPIYTKLCTLFKKPLDIPEQIYDIEYRLVGFAHLELSQALKKEFDQLKLQHEMGLGRMGEHCNKALKYMRNATDLQLLARMNNIYALDTASMQTALYNAIETDQEDSVSYILLSIKPQGFLSFDDKKPKYTKILDINDVHPLFGTALCHAAAYGKIKIIDILLKLGANTTTTDSLGRLPFYEAYSCQHTEAAELLEKNTPDTTQVEAIKLYVACQKGDIKKVLANLDKEHLFESLAMAPKTTFLHIAAYHGQHQLLQLLIDSKYKEVSTLDGKNATPIIKATQNGHLECFKLLHAAGAKLDDKNADGNSILKIAVSKNQLNIVRYLVENGVSLSEDPTLLIWAVGNKKSGPLIRYLIEKKVPINHETEITLQSGAKIPVTPLRKAIFCGNSGALKTLLEHNADANYKFNDRDALIDACFTRHAKIVELLKPHVPFNDVIGIHCCKQVIGLTTMHLNNRLAILQTLLNFGTPITPELIELAKDTEIEIENLFKRVQQERSKEKH